MKKIVVGIVVFFAVTALFLETPVFSACNAEPIIVNTLERMEPGWSGAVACYNGLIYEVSGEGNFAFGRNPVTGLVEDTVIFGSWAANSINGFTYDPFRGTFWLKVRLYAYEVPVTGGDWISRFDVSNGSRGMAYGIWKDPDEENVMWVADPVQPQIRKTDMRDGSVIEYITTTFNVRGISRAGDTLWCVRAGEPSQPGLVAQVNMSGTTLCSFFLPEATYVHDAGGCDIDPDGYLWIEGGKHTAIYQVDIGYVPTTPTPATSPTPNSPSMDSGDYNGDGFSDIAIFREGTGLWAVRGVTRAYFGSEGDIPAAGDFDGDGTTDITIFRGSTGLWAVEGVTRAYFGSQGDITVPGDYDGDGLCDMAVFRPASGLWAVRGVTRAYFGSSSDQPVALYLDGRAAGKKIAIFRPGSGLWAVKDLTRTYFGTTGDIPIIINDDSTDELPGIFRPDSGLWALVNGSRTYFGAADDKPVPGNYSVLPGNIGIFRESSGLWAIKDVTRVYYGVDGDTPVSGLAINPSSAAGL